MSSKTRLAEIVARLNEFQSLRYNWDSFGGSPIDTTAINEALRLAPMFEDDPKWGVFPRSDGGIQFEADDVEVHVHGA